MGMFVYNSLLKYLQAQQGGRMPEFIWKGRKLRTIQDVMSEISTIRRKPIAQKFLLCYLKINPSAKDTIGYVAAYYDFETCMRIWELFDVRHPIFGRAYPTPQKAFEMARGWRHCKDAKV